jgi:hypothetical protein
MVTVKTHAGENPHSNKQKINKSNGNVIFTVYENIFDVYK